MTEKKSFLQIQRQLKGKKKTLKIFSCWCFGFDVIFCFVVLYFFLF